MMWLACAAAGLWICRDRDSGFAYTLHPHAQVSSSTSTRYGGRMEGNGCTRAQSSQEDAPRGSSNGLLTGSAAAVALSLVSAAAAPAATIIGDAGPNTLVD